METDTQDRKNPGKQSVSLLFLIAITSAISLVRPGDTVIFFHVDEAFYMRIAHEMLLSHEPWIPTWFGDYAFHKPPLVYWLIMLSYSLLGISDMAARLPSSLSVILTAVFVFNIGKKLFNEQAGLLAGLLFATASGIIIYGHSAMMDLPLICLMTGSLLCFLIAAVDNRPVYLLPFFVLLGLSCLIKGPVSAVVIALSVIPWCIIYRKLSIFKSPFSIIGAIIAIALFALWPFMLSFRGLFNNWLIFFIFRENAGKFSDTVSYSPLILPGCLLLYLLPWTGLFIMSMIEMFKTKSWRQNETAFLLIWSAAVFIVYLIPDVRHQYYVLPVIPAASLLMAGTFHGSRSGRLPLYGKVLTAIPIAVFMLAIPAAVRLFGSLAITFPIVITELLIAASFASLFINTGINGRISQVTMTAICIALATVAFNIALPRYSFDIFPPAAQKAITSKEIAVAGYEPYIIAKRSGKRTIRVQASYHANDFLERNTFLVIPLSLMKHFQQESEDSLRPVEVCAAWKYWKQTVPLNELLAAVSKGDINSLIEEHYVVKKK